MTEFSQQDISRKKHFQNAKYKASTVALETIVFSSACPPFVQDTARIYYSLEWCRVIANTHVYLIICQRCRSHLVTGRKARNKFSVWLQSTGVFFLEGKKQAQLIPFLHTYWFERYFQKPTFMKHTFYSQGAYRRLLLIPSIITRWYVQTEPVYISTTEDSWCRQRIQSLVLVKTSHRPLNVSVYMLIPNTNLLQSLIFFQSSHIEMSSRANRNS